MALTSQSHLAMYNRRTVYVHMTDRTSSSKNIVPATIQIMFAITDKLADKIAMMTSVRVWVRIPVGMKIGLGSGWWVWSSGFDGCLFSTPDASHTVLAHGRSLAAFALSLHSRTRLSHAVAFWQLSLSQRSHTQFSHTVVFWQLLLWHSRTRSPFRSLVNGRFLLSSCTCRRSRMSTTPYTYTLYTVTYLKSSWNTQRRLQSLSVLITKIAVT